MRMWMVDPEIMCQKHLGGEHVECHMLVGSLLKGISLKGYAEKGVLEVHSIKDRHDVLAAEMSRRGMNHKSPLPAFVDPIFGHINREWSLNELLKRCPRCQKRWEDKQFRSLNPEPND